jgi:hypothetical protein
MTKVILTVILTLLATFQVSAVTTLKVRYYFDSNTINPSVATDSTARELHTQLIKTFTNSRLQNVIGFEYAGNEIISIPNTNQAGNNFFQIYVDAADNLLPNNIPNNLPVLLQEMREHKLDLAIAIIDRADFCGVAVTPGTGSLVNHPAFGISFNDINCIHRPTYPAHEVSHGMGLQHGEYVADLYNTTNRHWDNLVENYVGGYGKKPWGEDAYGTVMSGYYIKAKKGDSSVVHNHFSDKERATCGQNNNRTCGNNNSDGWFYIYENAYRYGQRSEFWN